MRIQVTFVKGDVTDESTVGAFCDRITEECGKLDVFYANVSSSSRTGLCSMSCSSLAYQAGGTKGTFGSLFKDIPAEVFFGTVKLNTLACVPHSCGRRYPEAEYATLGASWLRNMR